MCIVVYIFFFFKQTTAYEMRISDWSSDVCSSDLGPGIGAALAEAFAGEGYDIALLARGPAKLRELCADLSRKTGRKVCAYAANAGDEVSLKQGLDVARADFGDPDVLIYNAASSIPDSPTQVPVRSAERREGEVCVSMCRSRGW